MIRQILTYSLGLIGIITVLYGAYIPVKAKLAQYLMTRAWDKTAETGDISLPWKWLDAYPVAKLYMPSGDTHIVLNTDSGQALAFGPGLITGTTLANDDMTGIAAHKNTHFKGIKTLTKGDEIILETPQDQRTAYRMIDSQIIDTRKANLPRQNGTILALVTCYPFDALSFNGPLRYVVFAEKL